MFRRLTGLLIVGCLLATFSVGLHMALALTLSDQCRTSCYGTTVTCPCDGGCYVNCNYLPPSCGCDCDQPIPSPAQDHPPLSAPPGEFSLEY